MASDIDIPSTVSVYQPGEDWNNLLQEADEVTGYELLRDEMVDDLVGVPFLIVGVAFRIGVLRDKERQSYVSCEVRIAPMLNVRHINNLRRSSNLPALVDLDSLVFGPDSHIVFNDGSTGVYRQVVKYLVAKGFIRLNEPVVEVGGYGESSFDQPPYKWAAIEQGTAIEGDDGWLDYSTPIRCYCPRGLRLSQYNNEYTQTGQTRYIG